MYERPRLVYIAYGLSEGPKIGARLEATLREAGYEITRRLSQADAVIAHSGGCFTLPQTAAGKPTVIIGLPYLERGRLAAAFFTNIWRGFQRQTSHESFRRWLRITAWNVVYTCNLPYNLRMLQGMRAGTWRSFQHVTLVHN